MLPDVYYSELDKLTELHEASIGRLACSGVFVRDAFEEYRSAVGEFVETSLKYSVVSKRALQLLNSAISYCQCNAEFHPEREYVDNFGRFVAKAFYCIVGEEGLEDRQPGVPRII